MTVQDRSISSGLSLVYTRTQQQKQQIRSQQTQQQSFRYIIFVLKQNFV